MGIAGIILSTEEARKNIQKGAREFLEGRDGHAIIRDVIRYTLGEGETRAVIFDNDDSQTRLRAAIRSLLKLEEGRAIVEDILRDVLGASATRALILSVFSEAYAEERLKKDLERRAAEIRGEFTAQIKGLEDDLRRYLDAVTSRRNNFAEELRRDLEELKDTVRSNAKVARQGAEAEFEKTLKESHGAALDAAKRAAEDVFASVASNAAAQREKVRTRFDSEIAERVDAASAWLSDWMDQELARRAEPLITPAVQKLFVSALKTGLVARMAESYAKGAEEGRSEGYRYGHDQGLEDGSREGYDRGLEEGNRAGYNDGYTAGHSDGSEESYKAGYGAGLDDGFDRGCGRQPADFSDRPAELPFNKNLLRRVEELELSERVASCLRQDNIVYIGDLVQKSDEEMLRMPGFGRKSLNEIKEVLTQMGLHLGMEIPNWPPDNIEELSRRLDEPY